MEQDQIVRTVKDADDRRSKSGKDKESDEGLGDEGGKDAQQLRIM